MTDDVMTLLLALLVAGLLISVFGKKPKKSMTGWFTVVFPPKGKKGGKRKGR